MKPITALLFFLIFISSNSFAQVSFLTYYTKENKETKKPEEAFYYREIIIPEEEKASIQVREKYIDTDKTKLFGYYNNIADKIFVGSKLQAYSSGKIKSKEKYSFDGKLIDTAEYYHPNGKLRIAYQYLYETDKDKTKVTDTLLLIFRDSLGNTHLTNGNGYVEEYMENNLTQKAPHTIEKGKYENHKRTGEWTGTFMDGKYSFVENYEKGKLTSGISKDSINTEYSYKENNFMVAPDYPGGIVVLRNFMAANFVYPQEAIKNRINGTVKLAFTVDKNGDVKNIKIDQDLGYGTGESAVRTLKRTKKWSPGIMRGVPVNVAYTLPLRLRTN